MIIKHFCFGACLKFSYVEIKGFISGKKNSNNLSTPNKKYFPSLFINMTGRCKPEHSFEIGRQVFLWFCRDSCFFDGETPQHGNFNFRAAGI
jgi:hypothetical protein